MPFRFKPGKSALALLVALLILLVAAVYLRWWDRYIEKGLGEWAVEEVARRTDGAYRLTLGDLSFRPLSGSLSFDSATVVTDSARNLDRTSPLASLRAVAHRCVLLGVNVPRLFLQKSFDARTLGCDRVVVGVTLITQAQVKRDAPPDTLGINAPIPRLVPPLGLPLFRIGEVSFPQLSFTLRRPGPHGGASAVLEHASRLWRSTRPPIRDRAGACAPARHGSERTD
jgi:hypothetical protein